jgi:4-amino-4-deoxy-L-arabinose transferase-like glycosyltransferase
MAALVAANLVLGVLLAPHYGQSTDEAANVKYGELSLQSYHDPLHPYRDPTRDDKGPFYLMLWTSASSGIARVLPGWLPVDARHFVNFVAWQIALVSVYSLARRFASRWAALAATLLFETQPLLFGHAFINQKDSAFMAFFSAAVALGLKSMDMVDDSRAGGSSLEPPFWRDLWHAWTTGERRSRRTTVGLAVLAAGFLLARMVLDSSLRAWVEDMVLNAYTGTAARPVQWAFDLAAGNILQTPVSAYINRATLVMDFAIVVVAGALFSVALGTVGRVWRRLDMQLRIRENIDLVALAATVLGMALAIRSVALLAGALVACYSIVRHRRRSIRPVLFYFALALLAAFLFWPQLWGSPVEWFRSSMERSLEFPEDRTVLFRGLVYQSSSLPLGYLPVLMGLQFTIPAVVSFLVAFSWIARRCLLRGAREAGLWVLVLWFLIPFIAVLAFGVPIYDNFRHLLFMLPPLFVMTAILWDRLSRPLRMSWLAPALAAAILLPGVAAIGRLHPYEYIYFNELAGGVRGAFGEYLLDSWCTAYRETMRFVNETAPPGSSIAVGWPAGNAQPFFRADLRLVRIPSGGPAGQLDAYAVIGCNWATIDPSFFPDAPTIWSLDREGVPLAIVKLLAPAGGER